MATQQITECVTNDYSCFIPVQRRDGQAAAGYRRPLQGDTLRQLADFRIAGRQHPRYHEQRHALFGHYRETDHRDVPQGLLGGHGKQSSASAVGRREETQAESARSQSHRTHPTLCPVSPTLLPSLLSLNVLPVYPRDFQTFSPERNNLISVYLK